MIKQTLTTTLNSLAANSRSRSEFRSHIKSEAAKLKPSLIRTDLSRLRLTNEMWEVYQNIQYIDYPDTGIKIIMEEFKKAKLCR